MSLDQEYMRFYYSVVEHLFSPFGALSAPEKPNRAYGSV